MPQPLNFDEQTLARWYLAHPSPDRDRLPLLRDGRELERKVDPDTARTLYGMSKAELEALLEEQPKTNDEQASGKIG